MAVVSTLAAARVVLFTALNDGVVEALPTVAEVYDHDPLVSDPLMSVLGDRGIVTIFPTAVTPDFWEFTIRVYLSLRVDWPASGQKSFDDIIDTLAGAIDNDGRIGPANWTMGVNDTRDMLTAESIVQIGREDY